MSITESYKGRTGKERRVSEKIRKKSKEKSKKDEDVEKSAYYGMESFTHN